MKLLTVVETQVITALIGAIVTIVSASLVYFFTKAKEIEVDKKQRKLERYDDLLSRLTEFVNNPLGDDTLYQFILAYYRASAYASNAVLNACYEILSKIEKETVSNEPMYVSEEMINNVHNAIRRDINPKELPFKLGAFHIAYPKETKA
jgi:hypothetical protein